MRHEHISRDTASFDGVVLSPELTYGSVEVSCVRVPGRPSHHLIALAHETWYEKLDCNLRWNQFRTDCFCMHGELVHIKALVLLTYLRRLSAVSTGQGAGDGSCPQYSDRTLDFK